MPPEGTRRGTAGRPRTRAPFRGDIPATQIIREHAAAGGADPHRLAAALYDEALSRLDGHPEPSTEGPGAEVRLLARNALALFPVSLDESVAGALTPEWLEEFYRLSRLDADHRRHGRWYTARPIARSMARLALAAASESNPAGPFTILDPACGCGALLVPAFEAAVEFNTRATPDIPIEDVVAQCLERVVAADVDERALATAVFRLKLAAERLAGGPVDAEPRTYRGNSLADSPRALVPDGADIVVMNPPYLGNRYFEALPDPARARADLRRAFGWNDDLYTHFLHRAWDWLRPGGALCAITSDTFLTIPSKARTREHAAPPRAAGDRARPASAFSRRGEHVHHAGHPRRAGAFRQPAVPRRPCGAGVLLGRLES